MVISDAMSNLEVRIPGVLLTPVKLTESSSQAPGIWQLLSTLLVAGSHYRRFMQAFLYVVLARR